MIAPVLVKIKIKKWMKDHNLLRAFIDSGLVSRFDYGDPKLVLVLDYENNGLKYLFDPEYGGGSVHLLNDFDDEVLKPLNLHMEQLGPYSIGLFQGRKLPRTKRSR